MTRTNITALKVVACAFGWILAIASLVFGLPDAFAHWTHMGSHDLLGLFSFPVWLALVVAQWLALLALPVWIALIVQRHKHGA